MALVYCATCLINGKKYVGITSRTLSYRRSGHKKEYLESDFKFYLAIRKHGWDMFRWSVLKDNLSLDEALELEVQLISEWDLIRFGYNTTPGGQSGNPGKWSEEKCKRWSSVQKKRFERPEERSKARASTLTWIAENKDLFEEHAKIRAESIRRPEVRAKISASIKQLNKDNPEVRKAQTDSRNKTFAENPDILIRISRSLGGRPFDVYKDGKFIKRFETIRDCARALNASAGNISSCLRGRRNHTKGYTFKYSETGT